MATIRDIDRAAWNFAHSDLKLQKLSGRNMFEETLFYINVGLYLMYINGRISKEEAKAKKLEIFSRVSFVYRHLIDTVEESGRRAQRNTAYSDRLTKLRFAVKNEDPHALEYALACLDELTRQDVHLKLFLEEHHREDYAGECIRHMLANEKKYTDLFGNDYPFIPLLHDFFKSCRDSGRAELMK